MMNRNTDPRAPLREGAIIYNSNNQIIQIVKKIGCGTSCLVYLGRFGTESCVLKELFPEGMAIRKEIWREGEQIRYLETGGFFEYQILFQQAFHLQREMYNCFADKEWIVNVTECFQYNGTYYTLSPRKSGTSWDKIFTSPEEQVRITAIIAEMTEMFHEQGWLMVDIKDSNYLIDKDRIGRITVRLSDFDSIIRIQDINNYKELRYSSITASPEMIDKQRDIGIKSDIYSIVMMLSLKLADMKELCMDEQLLFKRIRERLPTWTQTQIESLLKVLQKGKQPEMGKRYSSCNELRRALNDVLKTL